MILGSWNGDSAGQGDKIKKNGWSKNDPVLKNNVQHIFCKKKQAKPA